MKDVLTQFANLFNEGGGMDTVIWFFALMVTSVLLIISRSRYLKLLLGACVLCFFISFSKLDLQWQTLVFAVLAALAGFAAVKAEKPAEKVEEPAEDVIDAAEETAVPEETPAEKAFRAAESMVYEETPEPAELPEAEEPAEPAEMPEAEEPEEPAEPAEPAETAETDATEPRGE